MTHKLCLLLFLLYAPVALSQPIGISTKHYDSSRHVSRSVLRTSGTEICNNNIDDDNNGLTDDKDFACYFNGLTPGNCKSNSVIWSAGAYNDLYWFDLNTGVQHVVGKLPQIMLDISWASNGKLYGIGLYSPYLYEIDPNTALITPVNNTPPGYFPGKSMTADAAGNLYLDCYSTTESFLIMKFNIKTGAACIVANLSKTGLTAAGDLTFLNGILYQTCSGSQLAKIDLRKGTTTMQTFTGPNAADFFGIVSMPDGNLYVSLYYYIYQVDPVTLAINPNPVVRMNDITLTSYGLTAYSELCQAPDCLGNTSIEAAGPPPPYCNTIGVLLKGKVTPAACANSTITGISWTTTNGVTVPGDEVKALAPGKYYLNYQTTTETCNRMDSFTLQYVPNAPFAADITYQLPIGCNCNGFITAIAGCGSGNYQYSWSTGATTATINNVCPGTYVVKVTDAGAQKDTTISVIIPPPTNGISGFGFIAVGEHCNQHDGSISINNIQGGTAPFLYAIDNQPLGNTPDFAALPTGVYAITVKDAGNCLLQQSITVPPVSAPQKLSYIKQDAYCGLLTGTLVIANVQNGSPPFSFVIDNGAFTPSTTITDLLPGPHTITVKDNYDCTLTESFTILQSEQLRIALNPKDTNICASQTVTFTATLLSNSAGVQYSWDNGAASNSNVFTTPFYDNATMVISARDNTGCIAVDSATINAPYCDSIFAKCVLFPNAFSPNHDGLNDAFGPHPGGCDLKGYQLSVYNRWGQLIFQTNNQSKRWSGATDGQTPQTGTYIYTCVWQDAAGHYHHHKGTVVLVR